MTIFFYCPTDGSTVLDFPEDKYLQRRQVTSFIVKPTVKEWIKDRIKKGCRKKVLYKRIPILSWLPQYNVEYAVCDLVAGFTVGLTVIPQAIAYASVAGLPPQVGEIVGTDIHEFFNLFFHHSKPINSDSFPRPLLVLHGLLRLYDFR